MTPTSGFATTLNLDQTLRRIEMKKDLLRLQPSATPIAVITNRLGSVPTSNPEFKVSQKDLPVYADAVNNAGGYNSSATSIVVDNGTVFWAGDTVKVPSTGEVFRVTGVSTNTLTVVRGVGGGAASIADDAELIRLGTAMEEGDTSPTPRFENPTLVTNYTQIFKTSWRMTKTAIPMQQLNGDDPWNEKAHDKGIEHKRDMELAFLFGKPSEINTGTGPRRTTGGALHFIQTNVTTSSGTLNATTELNPLVRNIFRYAEQDSILGVTSDLVLDVINGWGVGKLSLVESDNDKVYGLRIMAYQTPNGIIRFTPHRLLSESATYKSHSIMLDFGCIRRRHVAGNGENRETHIQTNIQTDKDDYREDQYLTECGLEFGQERRHGVLKGVTG